MTQGDGGLLSKGHPCLQDARPSVCVLVLHSLHQNVQQLLLGP